MKGVQKYVRDICQTDGRPGRFGLSTLSDWKRGRSVPKLEKMEKLAGYFGVTVDYLMGRPIKPSPDAVPPTDEEIKLALFGDITVDDEVLEEVKAFARFVQERRMK